MLTRFNDFYRCAGVNPPIYKLKKFTEITLKENNSKILVQNGIVLPEYFLGYPQRFSHGQRDSPF
jgi:hypothetical protein